MAFHEVRKATIEALPDGRFQHEPRSFDDGKDKLAAGEVTVEEVIALLNRCRGDQHETPPHHFDASQTVHIFKPSHKGTRWYIKSYLVEKDGILGVFISVHQ